MPRRSSSHPGVLEPLSWVVVAGVLVCGGCATPSPAVLIPNPPPAPMRAPVTVLSAAVVEGIAVGSKQYRDVVAIRFGEKGWDCSGTIIAPTLVLTADHCLREGNPTLVFFGDTVKRGRDSIKVDLPPIRYKNPLDSDKSAAGHRDRPMVVRLTRNAPSDIIRSPLLYSGELFSGLEARVVGFGYSDVHASVGDGIKRYGDVRIESHECNGSFPQCELTELTARGDKVDTCEGDSGGPLFVRGPSGLWQLAGITSRGLGSGRCGQGGIYMQTGAYTQWLRPMIKP